MTGMLAGARAEEKSAAGGKVNRREVGMRAKLAMLTVAIVPAWAHHAFTAEFDAKRPIKLQRHHHPRRVDQSAFLDSHRRQGRRRQRNRMDGGRRQPQRSAAPGRRQGYAHKRDGDPGGRVSGRKTAPITPTAATSRSPTDASCSLVPPAPTLPTIRPTSRVEKSAIVTGASRGIGAAIATLLGANGFNVAVNFAEDSDGAAQVVEALRAAGSKALAIQGDVSQESDVLRLFETAQSALGPTDALVNNAAITGGFARVEDVDAAAVARMLAVNISGTILCSREAVRRMSTRRRGRDGAHQGGSIVNISSLAARTGGAGEWVPYAASKGAVNSFTIGLAREVATEGIRVNAVAPGLIETGLHAAHGRPDRLERLSPTVPMQRPGTPQEVAAGVLWLLSPEASYVTGTILEIGGGR